MYDGFLKILKIGWFPPLWIAKFSKNANFSNSKWRKSANFQNFQKSILQVVNHDKMVTWCKFKKKLKEKGVWTMLLSKIFLDDKKKICTHPNLANSPDLKMQNRRNIYGTLMFEKINILTKRLLSSFSKYWCRSTTNSLF